MTNETSKLKVKWLIKFLLRLLLVIFSCAILIIPLKVIIEHSFWGYMKVDFITIILIAGITWFICRFFFFFSDSLWSQFFGVIISASVVLLIGGEDYHLLTDIAQHETNFWWILLPLGIGLTMGCLPFIPADAFNRRLLSMIFVII